MADAKSGDASGRNSRGAAAAGRQPSNANRPVGKAAARGGISLFLFGLPIGSSEQRIAWHESEERKRFIRFFVWCLAIVPLIALAVGFIIYVYRSTNPNTSSQATSIPLAFQGAGFSVLVACYLLVIALPVYRLWLFRLFRDRLQLQSAKGEVRDAEAKLAAKANEPLALSSLWDVTARRLDYYHDIATVQANASFRRAQLAMTAGFGILVLALVLSLIPRTLTSSLAIASIGGLSAALGGYIGGTFIKSQEAASGNLRGYFSQPLELSRFLLAERLLRELPEEKKAEGTLKLIEGISRRAGEGSDKVQP